MNDAAEGLVSLGRGPRSPLVDIRRGVGLGKVATTLFSGRRQLTSNVVGSTSKQLHIRAFATSIAPYDARLPLLRMIRPG